MSNGDCRVDYIKENAFPGVRDLTVDPRSYLESIGSDPFLHVSSLSPSLLPLIVEKGQLIKCLQFDSVCGDLSSFWSLDDHGKSLEGLNILICPWDVDELNLSLLIANCPNLETLVIPFTEEGCSERRISGRCFKHLGVHIKHLILGNTVIDSETMDHILNSNGRSVQEIEVLFPFRDSTFDRVLQLSNLRKLTFKACYCSYAQIINISRLIHLESLQVERLDHIHDTLDELFSLVFQNCRKLRQFSVSGVFKLYSHRLFEMIEENNLSITHLRIQPNLQKPGMRSGPIPITDGFASLSSLSQLQSLSLPHTDLNDDHLKTLLIRCPHLTTIDLSDCTRIKSTDHIVARANQSPDQQFSVYLQFSGVNALPKLPPNLKLCIGCRYNVLPLITSPSYDLI